jgi:hypothetical protein
MSINITTDTNTVKVVAATTNNVKIVDNKNNTTVSVSQPTTKVITVATVGPQGPQGPAGFPYTGSAQLTGSLGITGSASIVNTINNSTFDLHTHDQGPWLFQMFNDTYSTRSTVFEGGSFDTGEFLIGNSTDKPIQIYNNSNYESPTLTISSSGVSIPNKLQQGSNTQATGDFSHAEGRETIALGQYSHAEGVGTVTNGLGSHAGGNYTVAYRDYDTVVGQYNADKGQSTLFTIGNGADNDHRSNAFEVYTDSIYTRVVLNAQGGITGSLLGNSDTATSSSFASTASYVNPLKQNVQVTGSFNITGSLTMSPSSSFILPLKAATSPQIGSAYWSGSFLFVYNGTRYMSASFF